MKRIFFLDHAFHLKTSSSAFFIDLLSTAFDVETSFLAPQAITAIRDIHPKREPDAIVLWQHDYLAPYFLSQGYPTIVVPMFDGSGSLPDLHWTTSRSARFISFSLALHACLRRLQCKSYLTKYFPSPSKEPAQFSELRGFLWKRRPLEGFDVALVERLLGGALASLHVHDAPDDGIDRPWVKSSRFATTRSKWYATADEYKRDLEGANIFIAPREAEGIGHAFIEAMSRGMLVVANNKPTHSEYIAHEVNGLLFNARSPSPLSVENASHLGLQAWETAQQGYRKWSADVPTLLQFIKDTPRPTPASTLRIDEQQGVSLSQAFYAGHETYLRLLRALSSSSKSVV